MKQQHNSASKLRAGITTHYHNSKNYGGNLQAYATVKAISKCGYEAEQLAFPIAISRLTPIVAAKQNRTATDVKIAVKVWIYNQLIANRCWRAKAMSKQRKQAISEFNRNEIPHSKCVYSNESISDSLAEYDVFITGSDMVWNPDWHFPIFTLEFVPAGTPKFSYAPSMGVASLNDHEQEVYRNFLRSYQAVSVRERNAVSILEPLSPVPVEWVLDPTLLLDQADWNEICSQRQVREPYLFCYFLGSNPSSRRAAEEYAKTHGLKLVTIPYLLGKYRGCDYRFGDVQLSKVSPRDFISLIRYADCVFTDSFHACVFSFLYQREFFAFRRDPWEKTGNLGSRISSFLGLIDCLARYCETDEKEQTGYIEALPKIDYTAPFREFQKRKESSWDYLKRNLKLAEETIQKNEQKH